MVMERVQAIVAKQVAIWNSEPENVPLWVVLASPGDAIQVPGVTFGNCGDAKAGMEVPIHAHLIVLNRHMAPESLLTTFLHEYGHASHRRLHTKDWNEIDSEAEAIRYSLTVLADEGLDDLAHREAEAIKQMAAQDPCKSAVRQLENVAIWRIYARSADG